MNRLIALALPALLIVAVTLPGLAGAASYGRLRTISIPGNALASFDIGWVDEPTETYYLADRSNSGIDVIDAKSDQFVRTIGGFVGLRTSSTSGPNGVTVAEDFHLLFAGDGDSTMKVIDLKTNQMIASVGTGGANRADELAYDFADHVVLIANDAETVPFVTLISTVPPFTVLWHIMFGSSVLGGAATDGIEQPVWDPATRVFYVAIPATTVNPGGEVAVIDPRTMAVTQVYPVSGCTPHGLALGSHQDLLLGCNVHSGPTQILDARTGQIEAMVSGLGGSDEVWFNKGDHHYYLAASSNTAGPVLGIIDSDAETAVTPFPATAAGAHSVAADRKNNQIFVPFRAGASAACPSGCVAVYGLS